MRGHHLASLLLSGVLVAGGLVAAAPNAALANTSCMDGNSNVSYQHTPGDYSTWWAVCNTLGGHVHFTFTLECKFGGGGTTADASGTGGYVDSQSETCWYGQSPANMYTLDV
jgi:hypothetical protein